jgi:predicted permease
MEPFKPLGPVVPVFSHRRRVRFCPLEKDHLASVTEIIVYLGTLSLVFSSLASRPLSAGDIAVLFGGIALIFAGVALLIGIYFFYLSLLLRGFALPTLFTNGRE